jgi:uncharacterized protein (UPF0332 family)
MNADDYDMKAVRALASAKVLLADGDMEGACNRAYYAMFDAARAVLLRVDANIDVNVIKSHTGLIGTFGKLIVLPGLVSDDLGRAINQVEKIRLLADYSRNAITIEQASWSVNQAAIFIAALNNRHQLL